MIIWFVISMTYYGLSLNTSNMDGDPYLNCLISAATEFVGYGATWLFLSYIPRRFSLTFLLMLCGFTLLLLMFIPDELNSLVISLVMTGRTGIAAAFCLVYMYGIELFPTVVRNMGIETKGEDLPEHISQVKPLTCMCTKQNSATEYMMDENTRAENGIEQSA
ncbi:hypothetical protein AAFF_G00358340 [Aldrovandia affinis]|uniref:Sugar transporter n=1 Tax=Aldrovandia affinis TaxID=143900 RepID=A0AAD7X0I1_9TELE|nr:hypothetical protein AAFF_G00358340 [Aldrovandia affinis]